MHKVRAQGQVEEQVVDAAKGRDPVPDVIVQPRPAGQFADAFEQLLNLGGELSVTASPLGGAVCHQPPHIGGEVVSHQDSTFIYTEPESCTGFWFALEDATLENGCMQFIPGGHKLPLKKRNYRVSARKLVTETLDDTPWPENQRVPVEAQAGTMGMFHGRAPHLSAANHSSRSRHAYTLHVIDRNSHYPKSNWLQRDNDLPLRGFD